MARVKYSAEFIEKMDAYFSAPAVRYRYKIERDAQGRVKVKTPIIYAGELPTFEGFAAKHGIDMDLIPVWEERHPRFAAACERARGHQKRVIISNALAGNYNSSFAQYMLAKWFGGLERLEGDKDIKVIYEGEKDGLGDAGM